MQHSACCWNKENRQQTAAAMRSSLYIYFFVHNKKTHTACAFFCLALFAFYALLHKKFVVGTLAAVTILLQATQ